jgi:oxygen-dependent protoporphyrinogen oxidase
MRPTDSGWQLDEAFDAVVLAVPAAPASRLLSNVDGAASTVVGVLEYASVALVGVALSAGTELPERSGFLVPATEGTMIKAATFMSRKWPDLDAAGRVLVRMSVGRAGETENLSHDDGYLIEHALADLGRLTGTLLPAPTDAWVQRWNDSLPQYAPGHLDRVATVRAALAGRPGIALAGAAYDGVGIPACVGSGERAADLVLESLS